MTKKIFYGCGGSSGAVYGLGFLGALIYEIQHTAGLTEVLLGIVKSIVWPAFVTFKLFEFFRI